MIERQTDGDGIVGQRMLVADLLCGAGGSSTGCAQALAAMGLEMELVCVNHWPIAIETHSKNHPQARHYCQDISTVRPHIAVPEGYLDLLMASPSCTHHSVARGGKPTSDQQRSDPWHIITWLTELDVRRIIIENVWEFRNWGPVEPVTGKPIKARRGEYFRAWCDVIRSLGYTIEYQRLNAADFGEATTRRRFIMMGRKDGVPIAWPQPTHGDGTGRAWRPAREIIDWNIKGQSIYTRRKRLARKTLARIEAGAIKFNWPEPFLVVLRNHMDGKSVNGPLPTIAAGGNHIGLAQPIILPTGQGTARDGDTPLPTITTGGAGTDGRPGCARPMLVEPFILNRHGDNGSARAHDIGEPMPTADCRGAGYVVEPFVLSQASGGAPRGALDPLPTATTGGAIALISPYYGSGSGETCASSEHPLPTVTAKARFGLVMPVTHSDDSNRARDVETMPVPTLTTARRGELAVVEGTPTYDILFRMLEPHELAGAMGFNSDEATYEFTGTKTQKVKQIGNAVSVKKMRACVMAIMRDAAVPLAEAAE
ncbi:DNA (cytosine-5)-methyltransferase 1 [Bradyrhizobium elkanii]